MSFSSREGLLLILGFLVVSFTFAAFVGLVNAYSVSIALPMLSIAGIVLLLICLTGIAYVFARVGLHDRSQALGLPAGSIQSVIALSLIVLFAILSIFLFTSMGAAGSLRLIRGLSATDREAQIAKLGSSFAGWEAEGSDKFTLYVRDPGIEARNDVGKQLIVLIGTLMTSAVSFYFGSRATVAGAAATNPAASADHLNKPALDSPAAITKIEPETGIVRGDQLVPVTITGSGLSKVSSAIFKQGDAILDVTDLKPTDTGLTCNIRAAVNVPVGDYDVIISVDGKEIATKKAGLKVV